MKRKFTKLGPAKEGFTVLELLVVVVFIGILLTLIFTTYAGIREKERNTQRQTDINAMQDKLELYYVGVGDNKYPTLADMNNPSWLSVNMNSLDVADLKDPSGKTTTLAAKPAPRIYAYVVTASDGSACNDTTKSCAQYTLTATLEGGGTYTKSSLN